MATKRVRGYVSGVVQGVGYRYSTAHEAQRLGLGGYVRNLFDGRVEFEAEGEADAVDRLVAWAHRGPRSASVDGVETSEQPPRGDTEFEIRG
ncbi:acylphosphatase [Gulosibacter sediminis]|uniref:acylphosphatase n=1 Tax=Gulosibacter sediminis TaxID=1729695 RepID=UPI0024ADD300|nr:acylphosphatase [Gulosibacter sediminis]